MGNSLGIDLEGKTVILKPKGNRKDRRSRRFKVSGGFGASPHTTGTALLGTFLDDGKSARVSGYDVQSLEEE